MGLYCGSAIVGAITQPSTSPTLSKKDFTLASLSSECYMSIPPTPLLSFFHFTKEITEKKFPFPTHPPLFACILSLHFMIRTDGSTCSLNPIYFTFAQGHNSRNHSPSRCYVLFPLFITHLIFSINIHLPTPYHSYLLYTLKTKLLTPCLLSVFLELINFHKISPPLIPTLLKSKGDFSVHLLLKLSAHSFQQNLNTMSLE